MEITYHPEPFCIICSKQVSYSTALGYDNQSVPWHRKIPENRDIYSTAIKTAHHNVLQSHVQILTDLDQVCHKFHEPGEKSAQHLSLFQRLRPAAVLSAVHLKPGAVRGFDPLHQLPDGDPLPSPQTHKLLQMCRFELRGIGREMKQSICSDL